MNLRNYDYDELVKLFAEFGLPQFRAEQVFTALYSTKVPAIDEITTLSKESRDKLKEEYTLSSFKAIKKTNLSRWFNKIPIYNARQQKH